MTNRVNPFLKNGHLAKPLIDFAHGTHEGLDATLVELINTRASQINGCAGCLVLHTRTAREQGETEDRLNLLNAWREAPCYTDRERAALAWTEALTLLRPDSVTDEIYGDFAAAFSEHEQAQITMLIGAINTFNRMNVAYQVRPRMSQAKVTA